MNIVKQLRIKVLGNMPSIPNGVLIRDGATEYPVLMEALTNTVIFPQLMESGYKLIALPYTFEFNGQSITELPVEEYNMPTQEDEANLYNMVGAKFNGGNLSEYLSKPTNAVVQTPDHKYTITTREGFLQYLEEISIVNDPNDYLPINYFVSPAALFTFEEYFAAENHRYKEIIERRRRLSYIQYMKLFKFLNKFGITEDSTTYDIVKAYFAWGIDGIKWEVASVSEDMVEYPCRSLMFHQINVTGKVTCLGLYDNKKSKIVPKSCRDKIWYFDPVTQQSVDLDCNPDDFGRTHMPDGVTKIAHFERPVKVRVTTLACGSYYIQFDNDIVTFNKDKYWMETLRIQSFVPGESLSPQEAIPSKEHMQELYDEQFMRAIAKAIHKKRLVQCNATSYGTLLKFGLTPEEALRYIALKQDLTEIAEQDSSDEGSVVLSDTVISEYCKGVYNNPNNPNYEDTLPIKELLDNIVNGEINCDSIARGIIADLRYRPDALYEEIKVLHTILEIPLTTIYEDIKQAQVGDTLTYTGNNITRELVLTKIDNKYNGYIDDLRTYLRMAADNAYNVIEVQKIAREIGDNNATRHVALEFLLLTRTSTVNSVMDDLRRKYTEMAETYIADAAKRERILVNVNFLVERSIFDIYKHGKFYYISIPGAPLEVVDDYTLNIIRNNIKLKFDTIQGLTAYSLQTTKTKSIGSSLVSFDYPAEYNFGQVCVNAYITPTQIIPRTDKNPIPEVSFFALWKDYRLVPNIQKALLDLGIIDENFIPYSSGGGIEYCEKSFLDYNVMSINTDPNSAAYYAIQAEETLKESRQHPSYVIDVVQHPVEYLYPGIYEYSDDWDVTTAPRSGMDLHIGYKRDVIKQTFPENILITDEEEELGITPFNGYDAETFYLGVNIYGALPVITDIGHQLTYSGDKFATVDTNETYDYIRIKELLDKGYPVKHVRNNVYLVLTLSNELLEVHI